jgi:thiol:disulfide interchange protein
MPRRVGLAVAVSAAALLAGCASAGAPAPSSGASSPQAAAAASTAASTLSTSTASAETIPDHYDAARNPAADLKSALTLAATDHKEVLIDFGADWCPDCQVLDKLFQSQNTKSLLQEDYHVVAVDVGQFDRNLGFAAKYVNLETSGIPALVVLAPDGTARFATNDGSFENARAMNSDQVDAFLARWAPKG